MRTVENVRIFLFVCIFSLPSNYYGVGTCLLERLKKVTNIEFLSRFSFVNQLFGLFCQTWSSQMTFFRFLKLFKVNIIIFLR